MKIEISAKYYARVIINNLTTLCSPFHYVGLLLRNIHVFRDDYDGVLSVEFCIWYFHCVCCTFICIICIIDTIFHEYR